MQTEQASRFDNFADFLKIEAFISSLKIVRRVGYSGKEAPFYNEQVTLPFYPGPLGAVSLLSLFIEPSGLEASPSIMHLALSEPSPKI